MSNPYDAQKPATGARPCNIDASGALNTSGQTFSNAPRSGIRVGETGGSAVCLQVGRFLVPIARAAFHEPD